MNVLDAAGRIPISECYTGDNYDFQRHCLEVVDLAGSTNWGLTHEAKVVATLLRAWYDASSAAVAGVDEEEVAEVKNALKGANMARGRAEKKVQQLQARIDELEDLVRELASESNSAT
jgi:hypothetical protein